MKPSTIRTVTIPASGPIESVWIAKALAVSGFAASSSAAKNIVKMGAVRIDGKTTLDEMHRFSRGEKFELAVRDESVRVEIV